MRKQAIVMTKTWNKDLEKGASIEGIYLKKEVFDGKFGASEKYVIEDANDEKWGIFSSESLANQFKNIPEGSYVAIE